MTVSVSASESGDEDNEDDEDDEDGGEGRGCSFRPSVSATSMTAPRAANFAASKVPSVMVWVFQSARTAISRICWFVSHIFALDNNKDLGEQRNEQ